MHILDYTDLLNSKLNKTPSTSSYSTGSNAQNGDNRELDDPSQYRTIVGKLVYLTITQPNITYLANQLSQKMANPSNKDLKAAHKVLKYVKSSLSLDHFFPGLITSGIYMLSDSNWVSCPIT